MRGRLRFDPVGVAGLLVVLALIGFLAWFLGGFLPLMLLIVTAAAAVLSVGLLWSRRGCFRAYAQVLGVPEEKRKFLYSVCVFADQRLLVLPAWVRYVICNDFTGGRREQTLRCLTEPRSESAAGLTEDIPWQGVEFLHYGRISLELMEVRIYDFFHLCYWNQCERTNGQWIAVPAFSGSGNCPDVQVIELGTDQNPLNRLDFSTDYEIREYQPQDSMRDIHWKISARQEQWMVKERLADGQPRVNILMVFSDDRAGNDKCMEVLAARGSELIHRGFPIGLYWWSAREAMLKSAEVLTQEELFGRVQELLCINARECPPDLERQFLAAHAGERGLVIRYKQGTENG